ncbi:MAG: YfiT family bacillithiol transferase, partial [Bacilli bacterium]
KYWRLQRCTQRELIDSGLLSKRMALHNIHIVRQSTAYGGFRSASFVVIEHLLIPLQYVTILKKERGSMNLNYPIGQYTYENYSERTREACIVTIDTFPTELENVLRIIGPTNLDVPYRDGGWTARQLVHHLADSHAQAMGRLKFALTEQTPTIKPYDEQAWAELPDCDLPIASSLKIIEGVHMRWTALYTFMNPQDWEKTFIHPASNKETSIEEQLYMYDWHSRHHLAHLAIIANASQ